jgi:hypothetical protein
LVEIRANELNAEYNLAENWRKERYTDVAKFLQDKGARKGSALT